MKKLIVLICTVAIISMISCLGKRWEKVGPNVSPLTSQRYDLVIDDGEFMTDAKYMQIVYAASLWSKASNYKITFDVYRQSYSSEVEELVSNTENLIWVWVAPRERVTFVSLKSQNIGNTHWFVTNEKYNLRSSLIWLDQKIDNEKFVLLALHELGHAIGLEHNELNKSAIMAPFIPRVMSATPEFTCDDIITLCNIWKCDVPCTQLNKQKILTHVNYESEGQCFLTDD